MGGNSSKFWFRDNPQVNEERIHRVTEDLELIQNTVEEKLVDQVE